MENIIYMLKRNEACCTAVVTVLCCLIRNYSGITQRNCTSNTQPPMPRLIIGYHSYSARLLSTTPAVNYGRCMGFVTNALIVILEPIVYCAVLVKEDKTGTERELSR